MISMGGRVRFHVKTVQKSHFDEKKSGCVVIGLRRVRMISMCVLVRFRVKTVQKSNFVKKNLCVP